LFPRYRRSIRNTPDTMQAQTLIHEEAELKPDFRVQFRQRGEVRGAIFASARTAY